MLLVVALGACVDRKAEPDEVMPTVEEVCDRVCVVYDECWKPEDGNPYSSISECAETCVARYYAWPYDPEQRYECADLGLALQWCYVNLPSCTEFDAVTNQPGYPCSEEYAAAGSHACMGGPDPLDYVDTETG